MLISTRQQNKICSYNKNTARFCGPYFFISLNDYPFSYWICFALFAPAGTLTMFEFWIFTTGLFSMIIMFFFISFLENILYIANIAVEVVLSFIQNDRVFAVCGNCKIVKLIFALDSHNHFTV